MDYKPYKQKKSASFLSRNDPMTSTANNLSQKQEFDSKFYLFTSKLNSITYHSVAWRRVSFHFIPFTMTQCVHLSVDCLFATRTFVILFRIQLRYFMTSSSCSSYTVGSLFVYTSKRVHLSF